MNTAALWLGRTALPAILTIILLGDAHGQAPAGRGRGVPTRVPVSVALVERLPVPGVPFVLVRRADAQPGDMILLPRSATPEVLSDAVAALLAVRQQRGDLPEESGIVRLVHASAPSRPRARLPWAPQVLADLRRAPVRQLPDVGSVPVLDVWLPPQR